MSNGLWFIFTFLFSGLVLYLAGLPGKGFSLELIFGIMATGMLPLFFPFGRRIRKDRLFSVMDAHLMFIVSSAAVGLCGFFLARIIDWLVN